MAVAVASCSLAFAGQCPRIAEDLAPAAENGHTSNSAGLRVLQETCLSPLMRSARSFWSMQLRSGQVPFVSAEEGHLQRLSMTERSKCAAKYSNVAGQRLQGFRCNGGQCRCHQRLSSPITLLVASRQPPAVKGPSTAPKPARRFCV